MATATLTSPIAKPMDSSFPRGSITARISYPDLLRWVKKESSRISRKWRNDISLTGELTNALVDDAEDEGFDTTGILLLGFEVLLERYAASKA